MNSYCSAYRLGGNIYQYLGRKVYAKTKKYLVGTGVCLFVVLVYTTNITKLVEDLLFT